MAVARAQFRDAVIGPAGDAIVATVEVREPNTATKISETIYSDAAGSDVLANPFQTDTLGRFQMYLASPKRVDLLISATGYDAYTVEDVDVLRIAEGAEPAYYIAAYNAPDECKLAAHYVCTGTNDEVDFQAVATALGASGGRIVLSRGDFYFGAAFLPASLLMIDGAGIGVTSIHLSDSVNDDVMRSASFASLTGTNSQGGEHHVTVRNLTIDGNKNNNSAGYGIRKYGFGWILENVVVKNCADDGIWSEWGTYAGNPSGGDGMEEYWSNIKIHHCGGVGVEWRGPHDSMWNNVIIFGNGSSGLIVRKDGTYTGAPLQVTNMHLWGNDTNSPAIDLVKGSLYGSSIQVEGGVGASGMGIRCGDNTTLIVSGLICFNNTLGIQFLGNDHRVEGYISCTTGVQIGSGSGAVGGISLNVKFIGCTTCIDWANAGNSYCDINMQAYVGSGQTILASPSNYSPGTNTIRGNQGGGGTLFLTENGGAAAGVADGGTISHGLGQTPTHVEVSGSVAGEIVTVTAVGASTFTVAIKQHDGSAGTSQTIYWKAAL